MAEEKWVRRWKNWVARTKLPGVWKLKEGGFLVRARVKDPTTGLRREIRKVLSEGSEADALKWLTDESARVLMGGARLRSAPKTRFCDFAVSLLERKAAKGGRIKSAKSRERWGYTLVHLIEGSKGVPALGPLFMEEIRTTNLVAWRDGLSKLIDDGTYKPATINGWLGILRVIFKAATFELSLKKNPMEGIDFFDTSTHVTYTEEEPNSLTPEEAGRFLDLLAELYPQHFAMTYLALATGLRPSSLRPLRRSGKEADVLWDTGVLLVRRSQTGAGEVMNKTKTGYRQRITLPKEVIDVLRWHVETQLHSPEQQASELLFPSVLGRFRAPDLLNKAFADVATKLELGKRFTQRGLRRTFNDLARHAEITSIVTKSISGHRTDAMVDHYSTVRGSEQRDSIKRVLATLKPADPPPPATPAEGSDDGSDERGAPRGAPPPPKGAPKKKAG
jgi:integrase